MLKPLCAALLLSAPLQALEFKTGGKTTSTMTLEEMKQKLPSHKISFNSYFSDNRRKNYEGFAVQDVMKLAYDDKWRSKDFSDVAFIALDGYEAVGGLDKLKEEGGYLVFKDLDVKEGWEPVGKKKADPGPFFLVWTGAEQLTKDAYPWPWQISAINLIRFEDQYPAVVPAGAAKDSSSYRGFTIFKERCIRCHSINQQGGKIGPDLNEPQSVTAYRPKKMIQEFIKHPSKYRHTQMPDHEDLSQKDLDALYDYFKLKSKDSGKSW